MKKILSIDNLSFRYDDRLILDDISLTFDEGLLYSLVGSNKCGKTTLIKTLSGILHVEFTYRLNVTNQDSNDYNYYLSNINYFIYTNRIRNKNKTVISEIKRWMKKNKISRKQLLFFLEEYGLKELKDVKIKDLNNIEFVRFITCILLFKEPKIVFIDGLFDFFKKEEFNKAIVFLKKVIKDKKITIFYTTIKLDMCLNSDKVLFLSDGKIKLEGPVDYILEHDNLLSRDGVVISEMLDLSLKLNFYNLLNEIEFNPRKMVEKIWK